MFELITDVPAPILEFYQEEIRNEATGNKIEESYEYLDENEVTQIGTRLVDEYHDVTYVVELPRHDLKSWVFVENVSDKNLEFKTYCIEKACEAERWDFHDEYLKWLNQKPNSEDAKYLERDEAESPIYDYDADLVAWQAREPTDNSTDPTIAIVDMHESVAIEERVRAVYAPLTYQDVLYDMGIGKDGIRGIDSFKGIVHEVMVNPAAENQTVNWIASDNSVVLLTYPDVKAIVSAFNRRQQDIFNKYAQWRMGDKTEPFTYVSTVN